MPTNLTTEPSEKGTYVITAAFTDENSQAKIPTTLEWKLTDKSGNVINSRSAVTLTPAASVSIVLSGDDLALSSLSDDGQRAFLLTGTYDSNLGSDLPIKEEARFTVANLWAQT